MTPLQWVVTLAGVVAIVGVNRYFLFGRPETAMTSGTGPQRFLIRVDNAYSPAAVRVRAGQPVRLDFQRVDQSSCTEEVVIPDFGIRTFLPSGRTTTVEFTPPRPGVYGFECGMGMVRGQVIAESDKPSTKNDLA
jgi:plastocyanin domain-containing protein